MAQSRKNAERKRRIWSDRILSWKRSGLSQRAYCEQHQLVLGTFCYWRGRLKEQEEVGRAARPRFLPVTLKHHHPASLTLLIIASRWLAKCGTRMSGRMRKRMLLAMRDNPHLRAASFQPMNRSRLATRQAAAP